MSKVTILSSLAMGILVELTEKCKRRKQNLKLAEVAPSSCKPSSSPTSTACCISRTRSTSRSNDACSIVFNTFAYDMPNAACAPRAN